MFSQLPFYVTVGFCFGLFQKAFATYALPRLLWAMQHVVFRALAAGIALSAVALLVWAQPSLGLGLAFAGGMVGWAGGHWFQTAKSERDKLIFVAAAAIFVAVGVYEYDYRVLQHLTKFSAGSVDVEFNAGASGAASAQHISGSAEGPVNDPFPGRNRLNFAIAFLRKLPEWLERDEKYAELFSGYAALKQDLHVSDTLAPPTIEPATQKFREYFENTILPYVEALGDLHEFHKGEISGISLDSDVIFNLRLAFESTWFADRPDSAKDEFAAALCKKFDQLRREVVLNPNNRPLRTPQGCDGRKAAAFPALTLDGDYTAIDVDVAFSYFAVTAALAEFALDNRERAIQILDDVVENREPYESKNWRQRAADPSRSRAHQACARLNDAGKVANCHDVAQRLDDMRRTVLRARLEEVEDSIIEIADNPGLTAIRISLLKRALTDMDRAVQRIGEAGDYDVQALFQARIGASGADCQLKGPKNGEAQGLIALWTLSGVTLRANALESAAKRPDVVNFRTDLPPLLDAYADEVSRFNVDCARTYVGRAKGGLRLSNHLRSEVLASAAEYWRVKGERFGADPSDAAHLDLLGLNNRVQIDALCKARQAFQFAHEIYVPDLNERPTSDDDASLEDRGTFNKPTLEARLDLGFASTKTLLDAYPAGDLEKICP